MSMKNNEKSLHFHDLENNFPKKAVTAFRAASKQSLQNGLSVVQLVDGELRRIHPDGSYEVIKTISRSQSKLRAGQKLELA